MQEDSKTRESQDATTYDFGTRERKHKNWPTSLLLTGLVASAGLSIVQSAYTPREEDVKMSYTLAYERDDGSYIRINPSQEDETCEVNIERQNGDYVIGSKYTGSKDSFSMIATTDPTPQELLPYAVSSERPSIIVRRPSDLPIEHQMSYETRWTEDALADPVASARINKWVLSLEEELRTAVKGVESHNKATLDDILSSVYNNAKTRTY